MNSSTAPLFGPTTGFRKLAVGAALFLFGVVSLLRAQSLGSIQGVVTDADSKAFITGAIVTITGTELQASTDRAGLYRFAAVPAGTHTLAVSYLGLAPGSASVSVAAGARAVQDFSLKSGPIMLDAFKVESIREGQSRAINQQRTSQTISNIISSDVIGNLPDTTIADALTRLPGVSVVVEGGQAAYASIRGSEAKLNSVTLDGQRITATPSGNGLDASNSGDTRAVDLSLVPSELVGSIELTKALLSDKDADSFGGTINLITRSAYDLKERSINGKFEGIHNDFGNRNGYAAALSYADVLDKARTFGVSATVNFRKNDTVQDDTEILYYLANDPAVAAIAAVRDEGIAEYDVRTRPQSRETKGGTLNFDWKVSDQTDLHLRTLYNNSALKETRYRTRMRGLLRWNATSTSTLATGAEARVSHRLEDVTRDQDIVRLGLEGNTRFPGAGELTYGLTYGSSGFDGDRVRTTFEYGSSTVRRTYDWTVDRSDPRFPRVKIAHRTTGENGLTRPQDMTLVQYRINYSDEKDTDWVGNLDYTFEQKVGAQPVKWKVGTKLRTKDRTSRPILFDRAVVGTPLLESDFPTQTTRGNRVLGTVPTMGTFANLQAVAAYAAANPARFVETTSSENLQTVTKVYDAGEDVTAGYAMGSTKFGKFEAIAGLRYEGTDVSYKWLSAPGGAKSGGSDYGSVFPSAVVNYRHSKNLVVRLAATKTLARPDYADLVPFESVQDPESGTTEETPPSLIPVFRGNPNLRAQHSMNFDLSFEWYLEPAGVLSVSLFKKDVSQFIYRSQTIETIGTQNYIVLQQNNGATQDVQGVELSWQQSFAKLPAPFDGFGINANATFVDGSSKFNLITPSTLKPYQKTENFVPNQAKRVYNAQLYWEKYGFSARVAVNFTGDYVRDVGGIDANVVNDPATRWDAAVNYKLTKHLTLYLEGKNLTNEVKTWYNGRPARPEEFEHVGRSWLSGVKWRF
jgi:TonB-dependent receptor